MRYDFHRYLSIDIDDFLAGLRSWKTFVELARQLPSDSHYRTAQLDDDEAIAAELDALPEDQQQARSVRPSLESWSTLRADLTDIKDLLRGVLNRGSDKPIQPLPRPETAIDRYEKMQRQRNTRAVYEMLGMNYDEDY